ncbi:MAG: hypothetical protein IPN06_09990 [Burkholderiales bacterium]|nr:hypothetical protein [Burkholderiales bacterium]
MDKRNVAHFNKGYKADIDDATMMQMEEGASSQERGQQRRLVLLACARDSDTLVRVAKEEPIAFEEMAEMVIEYHQHAKGLFDIATTAFARIAMAHEMSEAA